MKIAQAKEIFIEPKNSSYKKISVQLFSCTRQVGRSKIKENSCSGEQLKKFKFIILKIVTKVVSVIRQENLFGQDICTREHLFHESNFNIFYRDDRIK